MINVATQLSFRNLPIVYVWPPRGIEEVRLVPRDGISIDHFIIRKNCIFIGQLFSTLLQAIGEHGTLHPERKDFSLFILPAIIRSICGPPSPPQSHLFIELSVLSLGTQSKFLHFGICDILDLVWLGSNFLHFVKIARTRLLCKISSAFFASITFRPA